LRGRIFGGNREPNKTGIEKGTAIHNSSTLGPTNERRLILLRVLSTRIIEAGPKKKDISKAFIGYFEKLFTSQQPQGVS